MGYNIESMSIVDLESQRLNLVKIAQYNIIIRVALAILIFGIILYFKISIGIAFLFYIPLYGFTLAWFWHYYSKFRKNFKNTVIRSLINEGSTNAIYQPENYVQSALFDESELFYRDYLRYNGEDLISFSDNGNLLLSELDVSKDETYTDNEGKTQTRPVTIFKGLFAVATFPFVFEGVTTVCSRSWVSGLGQFEEVRLESPRFMEIWSVRSTSQIGARLALNTDIMNNLLYFKDHLGKKRLKMSFKNNKVFIAIDQNSFLEPDYKVSALEQESVKSLKAELAIIQNIVATFKLKQSKNNKTLEPAKSYDVK
jgi:Protein of unknown function (DUF3137)